VGLLLGLLACDPDDFPPRIYLEDFETLCDGVPCGWERSAGEPGQARWVETVHPGEHALRLEGEVSVRGPAAAEDARTTSSTELSARLAMRCEPGNTVRLDVLLVDELGTTHQASGNGTAEPEWEAATDVRLTTEATAWSRARVTGVVLTKTGDGVCEIGELRIDDGLGNASGC
jgi:hypothetical protein